MRVACAQLMRMGWFRSVHVKTLQAQEIRALLTARKLLVATVTEEIFKTVGARRHEIPILIIEHDLDLSWRWPIAPTFSTAVRSPVRGRPSRCSRLPGAVVVRRARVRCAPSQAQQGAGSSNTPGRDPATRSSLSLLGAGFGSGKSGGCDTSGEEKQ
jgi:hypothetical protein